MADTSSSDNGTDNRPQEQIEACIKNLFDVPTKNIESAFGLILGLIREQSSKIECLKQEHVESLENNDRVRSSMQNVIDDLVREKGELSSHLQELRDEHETTTKTVDELKLEIEVSINRVYTPISPHFPC